jgi:hypothetical protein
VRACIHRGECSYVYEYLRLYCVSKKRYKNVTLVTHLSFNGSTGKLKLREDMQNYAKLVLRVYNPHQLQMNYVS